MEFVVFDGDVRMLGSRTLGSLLCFGEGVRSLLAPRPESAKCEDVESIVSGKPVGDSAGDKCAVGEADMGSGGLSMVARVVPGD